jgi:O-acetyl-ADP-ribose deacetylase
VIRVVSGDIATASAEAVLRPVSAEWTAVTAATRRLEVGAGQDLERQCRSLGELPVGSAVITGAGDLPAKFMIHVIIRSLDEPVTAAGVRRGLDNGLRRATEWGIRHVALPPLGTGAGNLDAGEAADIMVPLLRDWQNTTGGEIEVWVDTEYDRDAFATACSRA